MKIINLIILWCIVSTLSAQTYLKQNNLLKHTASSSEWIQTNGPGGGFVGDIVFDPYDSNTLYAIGQSEGIYKSVNSGENWTYLKFNEQGHAGKLEISSSGTGVLFCNHFNLSRSIDGGQSWQQCNDPFSLTMSANVFKVDPLNPEIIYAAGAKFDGNGVQIFKSENLGNSWVEITNGLPSPEGGNATSLALLGDGKIFIGINDRNLTDWHKGKVFYSPDDGSNWNEVDFGQSDDRFIYSIYANSQNLDEVWITEGPLYNTSLTPPYIYYTTDGGTSWNSINKQGCGDASQTRVIGNSPDGSIIYIAFGGDLCFTPDHGQSFTSINLPAEIMRFDIVSIAAHPENQGVLFLPTGSGGVAYSDDNGSNWIQKNEGILNTSLNLLAADPVEPGRIYCASWIGEGIFRTDNYGENWKSIINEGIYHPFDDELVVDPVEPSNVWFISDVPYIHKSTNHGDTWEVQNIPYHGGTLNFNSVYCMSQSDQNQNILYALNNGFGVYKGRRSNNNWIWKFLNLSEIDYSYTMVSHPEDPATIYSGYQPKPFENWAMIRKSTDGGTNWETSLKVDGSAGIMSIAMDPSNTDVLYAGSTGDKGAIYKTTDAGENWDILNNHFTMLTVWGQSQLIVHPNNPAIAYATTWLGGTWKTTDAGENWTLLDEAPVSGTSLSINPTHPDTIFLTDRSTPTVWRTMNGGENWEQCADFTNQGALLAMRVFTSEDVVFAATFSHGLRDGKIYKSTDLGDHWNDVTSSLPKGVLDINIDPTNSDIIYVTTNINGSYKSNDGGQSWQQMENFPDVGAYDIEIDKNDPNHLFIAARGGSLPDWFTQMSGDHPNGISFSDPQGIYQSMDGGQSWQALLNTSGSCRTIRQHPKNKNLLYAVDTRDGLMMSNDSGENWDNVPLENGTIVLTSCAVNDDKIYVGTQGCGIFCGDINTQTGDVTWITERSNKPVPHVHNIQIEVDPSNPDRIFVSANPGGLYRSDNGGITFADKNAITPSVVVDDGERQGYYSFALNKNNSEETWLGTWGKGIYKSYDGMNYNAPMFGADYKMIGKHIYKVAVDPIDGNTVYVTSQEGVFRTLDGGENWEEINDGLPTRDVISILINSSQYVVIGTKGYGMYQLDDGDVWQPINAFGQWGVNWPMWNNRPKYQYTSFLIHPEDNSRILLGTFPQGIYKSDDGGNSWVESNLGWTNDGVFRLVCNPDNPEVVYAGTYNGLNRSDDFGEHWEVWDNGIPPEQWVFSIDFDPTNSAIMYACSKNGENQGEGRDDFHGTVIKSTDGGNNWVEMMDGFPEGSEVKNQEFYQIIVDRFNPDIVYLVGQHDGMLISRNGGETWNFWNEGLLNTTPGTNGNNVTNTLVASSDHSMLYFGSAGSGVWRRMIAPILPVNKLSAEIENHQVKLNWNFEDFNQSFSKYNIYRSNTYIESTDGLTPIQEIDNLSGTNATDPSIQAATQYFYAITAEDNDGYENPYFYTLGPVVDMPLLMLTEKLDTGWIGISYLDTISITGGQYPINWQISDGALPGGLTLNENNGIISGTPLEEGSFTFTVKTNDNQVPAFKDSVEYTIFIDKLTSIISVEQKQLSESLKIYPNPFSSSVMIEYELQKSSPITVEILSTKGEVIRLLENSDKSPGTYKLRWNRMSENGTRISDGIVHLVLKAGNVTIMKNLVLIGK